MMVKLFILALSATLCCVAANPKRPSDSTSICERECHLEDYKCIRRRFCLNRHCAVRDDDAEAPKTFEISCPLRYEVPSHNITIVDLNTVVYDLDKCKIVEYCYNKTSGEQVTVIFCKTLRVDFHRTFYLHLDLLVDQFHHFNITTTFSDVTLTTVQQRSCGWNLCTSRTFAAIRNTPKFEVSADDEETQKLANSDIFPRALFLRNGHILARKYISSVFCDFGCN